jgi:hypothetical protein
MNLLDVVVVLLALGAVVAGFRLGFVTRVLSWIGMAVGLLAAVRLLPWLIEQLGLRWALLGLLVSVGVLFVGASIGQAVGLAVGNRLRPVDDDGTVTVGDGMAGALAGLVGIVVAIWLVVPLLADTPGWIAGQARDSVVIGTIDDHLPDAPDSMQALRALLGEDNFPAVFDVLRPTPDLGPPPSESGLSEDQASSVSRSVVKVEGIACRKVQDGTGFVVADDAVVTNAHVVAGEEDTRVQRDDGEYLDAVVVAFDPDRDLAVLAVPGLDRPALPVGDSDVSASGGVFGHPGGGPLRIAPFEVARRIPAVGRDIYGTGLTERDVLELRASLRPGDSGSALVTPAGEVVGVAFAIAPDDPDVAYALSTAEVRDVLADVGGSEVDTGPCVG